MTEEQRMNSRDRTPLVSLIIPNYNAKNFLRECLIALRNQSYKNCEVIIVDSASTDGSADMVTAEFPEFTVIKTSKMGIGEANNVGILAAKGDYIVFDLNSDEVVDKNWLKHLVEVIEGSSEIGIVSGKRYISGSNNLVDFGGGNLNRFTGIGFTGHNRNDSGDYKVQREVDFVMVPMIRRELVDTVGLCDPEYYIYAEDIDYCLRARKMGYKIMFVPTAFSWHKISGIIGKHSPRKYYYLRRNQIRIVLKLYPFPYLLSAFITRFFLQSTFEILATIPFVKKMLGLTLLRSFLWVQPSYISYLFKALSWNIKNMRNTIHARQLFFKRLNGEKTIA
jgi:GT2 family glycosyltransferase